MKKALLLIGLGIITGGLTAQSADSAASYSFSVQQAIDFALANQGKVKNVVLDERIARKKVAELTGMGLPQIKSTFDTKDFLDIPTQVIPAAAFGGPAGQYRATQFGLQYQASGGIDVSQILFSGDYFLGVMAAKVYVELASLNIKRTKIETAVAISKAYYTVLINEDRVALLDANIQRIKTAMDGTEGLLHYGFAEQMDFDRLKVAHNNLISEKEKIERLLAVGQYLLKFQMGMDMGTSLKLTDKLDNVNLNITDSLSAESFDYENRIEYNLLGTQLKLASLDLKRNRLSYLPNAYAYGSFSKNAYRPEFNFLDKTGKWYPTSIIGGTVSLPIFTGFQRNAKTQQAKLAVQKIENNLHDVKQAIDLEMASSITTLKNASTSLSNHKQNIELASRVVGITKMKFDRGVGTNLDIVSAESALKEAQINYYNALFEAIIAKIEYDKATGKLHY
jgi:outer membrane protein